MVDFVLMRLRNKQASAAAGAWTARPTGEPASASLRIGLDRDASGLINDLVGELISDLVEEVNYEVYLDRVVQVCLGPPREADLVA